MRTLNELYIILWDKIKDKNYVSSICLEIIHLSTSDLMSEEESYKLEEHFNSQKPNFFQHSEFLKSENWEGDSFWWNGKEDYNPINRKAFIQKMIKITKT